MAPDLKAMSRPAASELAAAWAVRTLARTDTIMPMMPAIPEKTAPMAKPKAASQDSAKPTIIKTTTPTMAMVEYCLVR